MAGIPWCPRDHSDLKHLEQVATQGCQLSRLPIDPDLEPDEQHPREILRHHLRTLTLIAIGGAIGASGRYGLSDFLPNVAGEIPWTTMLINVLGSIVLALVLISAPTERSWIRPLLGTGLMGGFTTFSAVAVETQLLLSEENAVLAIFYPVITIVVSIAVVGAIFGVARR